MLGKDNPLMRPFVTASAVSDAGAVPLVIRCTSAEPTAVKFCKATDMPDWFAPLMLTSMTQTFVGLVGESDAA